MAKLILLFVIVMSVVLPMLAATRPSPKRRLKQIQMAIVVVVFIWGVMCLTWYPQIVPLD